MKRHKSFTSSVNSAKAYPDFPFVGTESKDRLDWFYRANLLELLELNGETFKNKLLLAAKN